jgi:hypothetical protein
MILPKILITIDTEVGEKAKFVEGGYQKFVLGRIEKENYGVPKIVEMLNDYNFKGEFFIDIYEENFFGEQNFADLCTNLDEQGHGVQLHTHPSFAYDINRNFMHEYTIDEQIKIIQEGKRKIYNWIQKNPIAHRAGGYGANIDTIKALELNSILIDSSFYYNHPNCKIPLSNTNEPLFIGNVLEIPVSTINQQQFLSYAFYLLYRRYPKFDVNYLNSFFMNASIQKYRSAYITLFLHSSSFIRRSKNYRDVMGVNKNALKVFSNVLSFISEKNYEVVSFSDVMTMTPKKGRSII